jgi:hypothetical protein
MLAALVVPCVQGWVGVVDVLGAALGGAWGQGGLVGLAVACNLYNLPALFPLALMEKPFRQLAAAAAVGLTLIAVNLFVDRNAYT